MTPQPDDSEGDRYLRPAIEAGLQARMGAAPDRVRVIVSALDLASLLDEDRNIDDAKLDDLAGLFAQPTAEQLAEQAAAELAVLPFGGMDPARAALMRNRRGTFGGGGGTVNGERDRLTEEHKQSAASPTPAQSRTRRRGRH